MPELSSDDVSVELQEDVEEVSGADGCCMCVGAGAYMATPAPTGRGGGSVSWQRVSLSRLAWPVNRDCSAVILYSAVISIIMHCSHG